MPESGVGAASSGTCLLSARPRGLVERNGMHDSVARRNQLIEEHAQQDETVRQDAEDDGADQGADDRSLPAEEAGPAEHGGGTGSIFGTLLGVVIIGTL